MTTPFLISTALSSVAILMVVALRTAVRKHFGANISYGLWGLVPILAIVPFLPKLNQQVPLFAADLTAQTIGLSFKDGDGESELIQAALNASPAPVNAVAERGEFSWFLLIIAVWVTGVAIGLTVLILRQQQFLRSVGTPMRTDTPGVYMTQSTKIGPALTGLWSPKILLPADFCQRYSPQQQALIIAHERSHLRNGDHLTNGVVSVLTILFWFNPLVHIAHRLFRQDQEIVRDASVLGADRAARLAYGEALVASKLLQCQTVFSAAWVGKHPLVERVAMLGRVQPDHRRKSLSLAVVIALITGSAAAAWAHLPAETGYRLEEAGQLFKAPSTLMEEGVFPNAPLSINSGARINVIAQKRSDIRILRAPSVSTSIITDQRGLHLATGSVLPCLYGETRALPHWSEAAEIVIFVPETLALRIEGRGAVRVSDAGGGAIEVSGCGQVTMGAQSEDTAISLKGWSGLIADTVSGDVSLDMSDSSLAKLGSIEHLSANVIGASTLLIGRLERADHLTIMGRSRVEIDSGNNIAGADIIGDSRLSINRIKSDTINLDVVGDSELVLPSGAIDRLNLMVAGSGHVDVATQTQFAEIENTGAVNVNLTNVGSWNVLAMPGPDGRLSLNGRQPSFP